MPPIKAFPPMFVPPYTTKAPVELPVEDVVLSIVVVPPINAFPANPIPPETINAPEEVVVVAVVFVTANPESETIPVDGFTTKEVIVDNPSPEPLEELTVVMKND